MGSIDRVREILSSNMGEPEKIASIHEIVSSKETILSGSEWCTFCETTCACPGDHFEGCPDYPYGSKSADEWRELIAGSTNPPWMATSSGVVYGPKSEPIGSLQGFSIQDIKIITLAHEAISEAIRLNEMVDYLRESALDLAGEMEAIFKE